MSEQTPEHEEQIDVEVPAGEEISEVDVQFQDKPADEQAPAADQAPATPEAPADPAPVVQPEAPAVSDPAPALDPATAPSSDPAQPATPAQEPAPSDPAAPPATPAQQSDPSASPAPAELGNGGDQAQGVDVSAPAPERVDDSLHTAMTTPTNAQMNPLS